ncbi:Ras-related protein RABA5d [Camellia lanceoleosa]|uniref:Ras-related protein RABA5d n=1 Tax=Camellia lanceoleosa TaxID=1840588 RepID=A0ACC0GDB3_9ERIC|nr:Ras-related protein RABA5d [Camellia lanceoleosa]
MPQIIGSSISRLLARSPDLSNPNKPNKNVENRRRRVLVQDSGDWGLSGGKSNLLSRFVRDEVDLHSKAIVGIEFQTQVMELDGKEIEAQVWDTTITSAYYRGTIGALVVYDITRRTTFDSIKRWLNELKSRDWML